MADGLQSWAVASGGTDEPSSGPPDREDPSEDTASYVTPFENGLATVRGLASGTNLPGKEPLAVWVIAVGAIAFLVVVARAFKTAKA